MDSKESLRTIVLYFKRKFLGQASCKSQQARDWRWGRESHSLTLLVISSEAERRAHPVNLTEMSRRQAFWEGKVHYLIKEIIFLLSFGMALISKSGFLGSLVSPAEMLGLHLGQTPFF